MTSLAKDTKTDKRRRGWTARTDFQRWIKPLLEARAAAGATPSTYQELYEVLTRRGVDVQQSYVYKIVRGDPAIYLTNQRPGYEVTLAIGEIFGDAEGAINAAGFTLSSQLVAGVGTAARPVSGASLQLLDMFEGMSEPARLAALGVVRALRESEKHAGAVLAPGETLIADVRDQLDSR